MSTFKEPFKLYDLRSENKKLLKQKVLNSYFLGFPSMLVLIYKRLNITKKAITIKNLFSGSFFVIMIEQLNLSRKNFTEKGRMSF